MLEGQTGVLNYTFEGIDKIAGFAPVALTGWSIGVTQPSEEFMAAANAIRNVILVVSAIFLALTVLGVLWFARSISKPVNVVIEGLNEGADQVASASGQVSRYGSNPLIRGLNGATSSRNRLPITPRPYTPSRSP